MIRRNSLSYKQLAAAFDWLQANKDVIVAEQWTRPVAASRLSEVLGVTIRPGSRVLTEFASQHGFAWVGKPRSEPQPNHVRPVARAVLLLCERLGEPLTEELHAELLRLAGGKPEAKQAG